LIAVKGRHAILFGVNVNDGGIGRKMVGDYGSTRSYGCEGGNEKSNSRPGVKFHLSDNNPVSMNP
jgi:hypothetical protein